MKKKFLGNSSGQGLIEYLVIVALVAAGSIAIMRTLGQTVQFQFAKISKGLGATSQDQMTAPVLLQSSYQKKNMSNFLRGTDSRNNENSSDSSDGEDK